MTAIDRAALIEAAAEALEGAYARWSDLVEVGEPVIESEHEAMAAAVVSVVAAALLKPLRELVAEWRRDAVELQRELGPRSAAVTCTLLDANALESLLDQIESDLAGGSHA